jgi:C4-type Zn-finger protein
LELTLEPPPPPHAAAAAVSFEPSLALPLPGTDGNRACEVRPVSGLAVPCAMCSQPDGMLSFFDMIVPHYGKAELVSFSCGDCGYKYNKVRTGIGCAVGRLGRTLVLHARSAADLRRELVTSDVATVRLEDLDLEVQATGRYTTVEGLVTSLGTGLARAAIATCAASRAADEGVGVGGLQSRIESLIERCQGPGVEGFTLSIADPVAMSFIADPPDNQQVGAAQIIQQAGVVEQREWQRSAEQELEFGCVDATTAGKLWEASLVAAATDEGLAEEAAETPQSTCDDDINAGGDAKATDLMAACEALAAEFTRTYDDHHSHHAADPAIELVATHESLAQQEADCGAMSDVD